MPDDSEKDIDLDGTKSTFVVRLDAEMAEDS
jgi:hypothetical protein